jgi:hypothetical protein
LISTRILLILVVCFHLVLAPGQAAAALPEAREDLVYQVSLGPWDDVAKVHLVLKELEPGHYLAEFSGAAQGMGVFSPWSTGKYLWTKGSTGLRSTASTTPAGG